MYKEKRREENPPHIFAVADGAMRSMLEHQENQSLLITGESGAGKTENTKRVIQYLAATAADADATGPWRSGEPLGLLERQILEANPILESFGNAQTVRNNNSSRFGKFIRIEFSATGTIAGGHVEWYLLEKSRVHSRSANERSFHVFYQLLRSHDQALLDSLALSNYPEDYAYLASTRKHVEGIDDTVEFRQLLEALRTMGFSSQEEHWLFLVVALILHLGNISLSEDRSGQARVDNMQQLTLISELMGVEPTQLHNALVRPTVRAGREMVTQARTKKQVQDEIAALCKTMYEKTFGWLVDRINTVLDRPTSKSQFIGVLDIAGFEIFETNSFEQLCINYTNEKLQQFFNHHMFMLEQQEYAREDIDWDYVNFGLDLQPTIDLIESSSPIGILATLDEECIMPKASDATFTEKLIATWGPAKGQAMTAASSKFVPSRQVKRFMVRHYAANVEYSTDGWLDKNRDPLNDNITRVLAGASHEFLASLFVTMVSSDDAGAPRSRRGAFRTVGQRHKEQLASLMAQLDSTQPHFVRCIVPNSDKRPGRMDLPLVLDQLRCNGVLEGIRIARLGYPNRTLFAEFVQRYALLAPDTPTSHVMDSRLVSRHIAESLDLDPAVYRIGTTKIFFKAGVLAELEERRNVRLHEIFTGVQAVSRGFMARRLAQKRLRRKAAKQLLQGSAQAYAKLQSSAWWRLYLRLLPLLAATENDEEARRHEVEMAMVRERAQRDQQERERLAELERKLRQEYALLEEQLDDERTKHASTHDTLTGTMNRLDTAEAALAELQAERDEWARDMQSLQDQLDDGLQREKDLQVELSTVSEQLTQELTSRANLEHEHGEAIAKAGQLEEELATAKQSLQEHMERTEQHIESLAAEHEVELQHWQQKLERAVKDTSAHEELTQRLSDAEAKHASLLEAHEAVAKESASWQARALEATQALEALTAEHEDLQTQHEQIAEKHASHIETSDSLRVAHEEAQETIAQLEQMLDTEREKAEIAADAHARSMLDLQQKLDARSTEVHKLTSQIHSLELENKRLETLQNKTTIEHVHVLEEAKKYTDRQLSDVQAELQELSTYTRSLERTRARLQQEHEALTRTSSGLNADDAIRQRDEAREALQNAEKNSADKLRKTRAEYEVRIRQLEDELRRAEKEKSSMHPEKPTPLLGNGRKSHTAAARQVLAEIQLETELLAKDLARASAMRPPTSS